MNPVMLGGLLSPITPRTSGESQMRQKDRDSMIEELIQEDTDCEYDTLVFMLEDFLREHYRRYDNPLLEQHYDDVFGDQDDWTTRDE